MAIEEVWYWQYTIDCADPCDIHVSEERSGVIAARDVVEAVRILDNYYGEQMLNILSMKPICDTVLEFEEANEEEDFDFVITRKLKRGK